jgi:hypothetical protein
MEERYNFEEFHCATNSSQPVHISLCHSEEITSIAPLCPRKFSMQFQDNRRTSTKSSESLIKKLKPKVTSGAAYIEKLIVYNKEQDTKAKSETSSSKELDNTASTDEERKDLLTEFLSPSPFRNEDPNKREVHLDHLITSAPCPTKKIIFSTFYDSEITGEGSHHAWKIALKDYIVHTFKSICLIKKLYPVPLQMIENKKQNIESLNNGKSFNNKLREETFSI